MKQFLHKVMLVIDLVMLVVGLLFLARGYVVWSTWHEDRLWRAILSFVCLIPGWALTTMGYVGLRIEGLRAARHGSGSREST